MSKEIEKKIVEMTFDNTQFEKGVKQTMNTIDKFNEKLSFNHSTEGIERIQKSFDSLNMRGAIQGLDNFTVRFSGLSVFVDRIIENITDDIYSAIRGISAAIDKVFNQIKTGGDTRALNIEQAKFQLSGLGVAWDEIKDDINYAVKDTAYGLDSAAKAASQLVASNVQLGEEMRFSLRGISGLAAMTNSSYEDIARIFTKVAGQGRLMGDDLNSVAARGINVAAELGKVFNVTEADIRDMVSKGQIDFKTFAKAMDDAFGQHAKDANKTYAGSLSNVKAALNRLGADIATTKFEALRDIFNDLIPKIDEFKKEFKPAEDAIKRLIVSIRNLVQGLISRIDIPKITSKISNAVVKVVEIVEYLIDQFSRAIDVVRRVEGINAFKKIEDEAKGAQKAVKDVIDTVSGVGDETEDNIDKIRKENKELQAAKDIVDGVYGVLNGQERIDYIKDVLHMDPEVIQGYINQVYDAGKTWDEVTLEAADNADKANTKYEKLSTTIKNIVKTFAAVKHIVKNVFDSIKNVANVMISSFRNAFDMKIADGFSKIPDTLTEISDKFKITEERAENLRPVFDTVFSVLRLVVDAISKLIGHIKNFIEWIKNNETIQNIATAIKNLFVAIFDYLKNLKDRITESEVFKNLVTNLKPVVSEIGEFISYIFNGITSIITRATEAINELMSGRSFFEVISEFLFGTEAQRTTLYGIIKGGFIVGFIGMIAKAIFKMRLFMNDGIFYIFKFLGVLSNLSRVLFTYRYYLRAQAFTAIAKGIGMIVLAIVGLAYYINKNGATSIIQAAIIISAMVGGMLAIMHAISKIEGAQLTFGGFIKASIVVRSLGLAILSISAALYFVASAIDKYNIDTVKGALGIIIAAMASLVAVMFVLSKMTTTLSVETVSSTQTTKSLERVGRVLIAMSLSMLIISKAISSLTTVVNESGMIASDFWIKVMVPIISLMVIMSALLVGIQKLTMTDIGKMSLMKVASVLIAMALSVYILTKAISSLIEVTADQETTDVWKKGIGPLLALMGAMIVGVALLSLKATSMTSVLETASRKTKLRSTSLQRVAGVILSLSISIFIISKALSSLLKTIKENEITTDEVWLNGILPVFALLVTIFTGLTVFSKIVDAKSNFFTPGKYASLALMIVGIAGSVGIILLSLSHLLKVIKSNKIESGEVLATVVAAIGIFASIIIGFIAIAKMVKGIKLLMTAVAMLAITTTLVACMAALGLITTVFDIDKINMGITSMIAIALAVSLLGLTIGPSATPGILALSAALLSFGAALIVLSIGAGAASLALVALSIALPMLAIGITDSLTAIVKGLVSIVNEIPALARALVDALTELAYSVGKVIPAMAIALVKGFVDAIMEALDSHSPSRVFMEIGGYCIEGLAIGLFNGLKTIWSGIKNGIITYIVDPFLNFWDIHSPSGKFYEWGGNMIDGLDLGIQDGLSNFDTESLTTGLSDMMPNMEELGINLGSDFTNGLGEGVDFSDFSTNMGTAINDSVVDGLKTIDPTTLSYTIEDLMNRPELYNTLKDAFGNTGVVAAYDAMKEHEEFLAKNPTLDAYIANLKDYYTEEVANAYKEILESGSDEDKEGLEAFLAKEYMDKVKLDEVVYHYSQAFRESVDRYMGKRALNKVMSFSPEYDRNQSGGMMDDWVSAMLNQKELKTEATVVMNVQDSDGNTIKLGNVENMFGTDGSLNMHLDDTQLSTNLDAVSGDISNAINAQGDKLGQKLEDLKTNVISFNASQETRTQNLINRINQMESAINNIKVQLDTGALVGQLVVPFDEALGERSKRKARG